MRAHVIDHYHSMARARDEREADPSAPTNVRYWGEPDIAQTSHMSAYDPKRTLQRGSLSEGNVAAPSAWQRITVCSNWPS